MEGSYISNRIICLYGSRNLCSEWCYSCLLHTFDLLDEWGLKMSLFFLTFILLETFKWDFNKIFFFFLSWLFLLLLSSLMSHLTHIFIISGVKVLCANVNPQTNVEDRLASYFRNHTGLSSHYLSSMKKRVNLLKRELWKITDIVSTTFSVKPQASCKLETPCALWKEESEWLMTHWGLIHSFLLTLIIGAL